MQVTAAYFDGKTTRRYDVRLSIEAGWLELRGETQLRREMLTSITIPAPLGSTPRIILFKDGARCEVADHAGFSNLLQSVGYASSLVSRLEAHWKYALAALVLTLGFVGVGYLWGLPALAQKVAEHVPAKALDIMDAQFFAAFDGRLLRPSKLPPSRQQSLAAAFMALQLPMSGIKPTRILFRSSSQIGPNAFALPGGSVVVLDELVALADNDEQVLAVMAHEMGHVSEHHALRQMLQASVVGLAMAWYVGDVSSLLAAAPSALLETRYSRDFEQRADDFAARMLTFNHISPARLAEMLDKLEMAQGKKKASRNERLDYLSTHPATDERIQRLRSLH